MSFAYHHPATVAEAVGLAARLGETARFIAGGTDLVIQMHRRRLAPEHVIDLSALDELRRIDVHPDRVSIGALVTHRQIERHPAFQGSLRALVEGARVVGGHQVRNVGTVGGNIVNASPAADVVPALLALDAELSLTAPNGERRIKLQEFLLGPGRTDRRPGELLTRIDFPALPPRSATSFLKGGRRRAMEISVVCIAAKLTLDGSRRIAGAAIALGAVAPTTLRSARAEAYLSGREPTAEILREAGRLAAEAASPIADVRSSAEYRRHLVSIMVPRALEACMSRAAEQGE
jgi:carbon-monoxide dehydrogenase medium subunit